MIETAQYYVCIKRDITINVPVWHYNIRDVLQFSTEIDLARSFSQTTQEKANFRGQ